MSLNGNQLTEEELEKIKRDSEIIDENNKEQEKKSTDSNSPVKPQNNDKQEQEELSRVIQEKLGKKVAEEKEKMHENSGSSQPMRMDGEATTAFLIIFSNFLDVFKDEISRIRKNTAKEKLALFDDIREAFEKNGKLTQEMLDKTALLDKDKETLLNFSNEIAGVSKDESTETKSDLLAVSPIFKKIVNSSRGLIDNAKNNISLLMNKGLDTIESSDEIKDIDVDKDVLRDTLKNKNKNVERQRLR